MLLLFQLRIMLFLYFITILYLGEAQRYKEKRKGLRMLYCHCRKPEEESPKSITVHNVNKYGSNSRKSQVFESSRLNMDRDDTDTSDKIKKAHNSHQ